MEEEEDNDEAAFGIVVGVVLRIVLVVEDAAGDEDKVDKVAGRRVEEAAEEGDGVVVGP